MNVVNKRNLRFIVVGPKSGKVRKVAEYVPGSGIESLRNQADRAADPINKAKMVRLPFLLFFRENVCIKKLAVNTIFCALS